MCLFVQLRQHDELRKFKDVVISVINEYINRDKDLSCTLLLSGMSDMR